MFVVERLNLRVKQAAEAVANVEMWERSASCPLLTKQYNQLAEGGLHFTSGLLGPRRPPARLPRCRRPRK
eukprot:3283630-Pyramimonas_sp.AAC.1